MAPLTKSVQREIDIAIVGGTLRGAVSRVQVVARRISDVGVVGELVHELPLIVGLRLDVSRIVVVGCEATVTLGRTKDSPLLLLRTVELGWLLLGVRGAQLRSLQQFVETHF